MLLHHRYITAPMSRASSETHVSVPAPKVVCVFLAQFDIKLGYKLVWTNYPTPQDLAGIEARALPSGIHEHSLTTVYLTHELQGQLHYGFARFRQLDLNPDMPDNSGSLDRLLVKMYSLGVLVEPLKGKFWPPHQYLSLGWEYSPAVDAALIDFLNTEDLSLLDRLADSLNVESLRVPAPKSAPVYRHHPLSKLPAVLSLVGPLLFSLYKAAILRKRILILGSSSQGHAPLTSCTRTRDPSTAGELAYVLSLVSVVPKDVNMDSLGATTLKSSRPIYTVGLYDLESDYLSKFPAYIAYSGDEILKLQTQIYDVVLQLPADDCSSCKMTTSTEPDVLIKSTYNDYTKFLKLYQRLPQLSVGALASDDLASIKTSSSILSALGLAHFVGKEKLAWEPQWWLADATSPISWREYVWLAFAWFASAGATTREAEIINLVDERTEEDVPDLLVRLTSIVGQFHRLTRKWFYVIDEIVSEMVEYAQMDAQGHFAQGEFVLELTLQDVVDMELDPYSLQDLEFIKQFALMYWGETISDVEIGLGVNGLCC